MKFKGSTALRQEYLGPSYTRCILRDKQTDKKKKNQAFKDGLHGAHYPRHFSFLLDSLWAFHRGRGFLTAASPTFTSVVTNLMMIIWFIFIIFYFKGHICHHLISDSWILHLQIFHSHTTEELGFIETSGFRHANEGWHFSSPEVWVSCYWRKYYWVCAVGGAFLGRLDRNKVQMKSLPQGGKCAQWDGHHWFSTARSAKKKKFMRLCLPGFHS